MATILIPTLSIKDSTTFSDEVNFSVTDSLSVTSPSQSLSTATATTTGADTVIVPNLDARRFLFLRHTSVDSGGSTVTTNLKVEEGDGNWFSLLGPGEWLFVPLNANGAHKIQLEATGGTIVAEYAYWTRS